MPAPNSSRTWLPEMLDALEREWNVSLSWEECGAICERMTELRTTLRRERGIKNPHVWCRECNQLREMILAPLSIWSMLFALRKRGRLTDEELKSLDKTWQRYRRKNGLDGRAKKLTEPACSPDAGSTPLHQHRLPSR